MRLAWWVFPLLGLGASACLSGQTGSADCIESISCGCEFFSNRDAARGRVIEVDEARGRAVIELEEILTSMPIGPALAAGQRVVGPFAVFNPARAMARLACEDTRAAPPVVEEQVLVTFNRWDYEISFWLLPWADQYDFAGTMLSTTELRTLSERDECASRFPPPPVECNDVVAGPFGACALAPAASPRAWVGLVVMALAGVLRRLRRGRRRR
jgi:hypothetical protein